MKRLILALAVICALFLAGCQSADPTVTTLVPPKPVNDASVDSFDPAEWKGYSDLELLELTMESDQNEFRQLCAVWMTAEEWKENMLENCEPFRALMLRDTALKSLEEHTVAVVEQYKDEFGGMLAENFVLLVQTVHPGMKELLREYEITFAPRIPEEEVPARDMPVQ